MSDQADEWAREALPCYCEAGRTSSHLLDCAAVYRPAVADAIRKAVAARDREWEEALGYALPSGGAPPLTPDRVARWAQDIPLTPEES